MRYIIGVVALFLLLFAAAWPVAAQSPALVITSPHEGEVINGTSVAVSFQVSGFAIVPSNIPLAEAGKHPEVNKPGQGHLHLVLDTLPLAVQYSTDAYTFNYVQPGRHQLMVELANNDHSPLIPPVMQTIQFQTTAARPGAQPGTAPNPTASLQVTSPANGATINAASVTVNFRIQGLRIVPSNVPLSEAGKHPEVNRPGEGHLHLMLDLQPMVVWFQNAPYTFDNLPSGPHQLVVELANNDHSSLTPPVVQTITFRTEGPSVLPETGAGDGRPWLPLLSAAGALGLASGALGIRNARNKRRLSAGNRQA